MPLILRLVCGFPHVNLRGGGGVGLESVLKGGSEKPPFDPVIRTPPWSGALSPRECGWAPTGRVPLDVKAWATRRVESGARVTHCCVCNRRLEMEGNGICGIRVAGRGAEHLRMLLTK